MKTVVKYANRKLYDKDASQYITITQLLKLPLGSFKVVRHGLGEDVTTDTLLSALTSENVENETKVEVMKYCITELKAEELFN